MTVKSNVADLLKQSVKKSKKEPRWFVKNILKQIELCDEWQLRLLEAIADVWRKQNGIPTVINHEGLNRFTIKSCHGPGKTHTLALILHWWNYCFYGLAVGTAPKQTQIRTRFMPRYRKIRSLAPQAYQRLQTVDNMKVAILKDPDWGFIGETASQPENMAGYHDTPQLILVDESSARNLDEMFPVIEGTLTTPGSVLVIIGNPTRMEGEFYNSHNKTGTKELYYRVHVKPADSRYVSKQWVETMGHKYGIESAIYKIRVLGEFASYDSATLINLAHIEEAKDWEEVTDGSISRLRVSVDVSNGGADSTQITVARHYDSFVQVLRQKGFWFNDATAVHDAAKAAINLFEAYNGNKNHDQFIVDGIGVGAGTASFLIDKGYNVVVHKGSETVGVDTTRWRNRRVMCAMKLWEVFKDGKIRFSPDAIDDDEMFIQHMSSVKRTGNEKVDDIETKEKLKKDFGFSPDKFDSLAMQFSDIAPAGYRPQEDYKALLELNNSIPEMESANVAW